MEIGIEVDLWMDEAPVPMDKKLVAQLTALCEKEKVNFRVMHSGAGHDAQFSPPLPDLHDIYAEHQWYQP